MKKGMISAPQPEAVDGGADVLRAGGNAVGAAIACAFIQGVVDPLMTGIGGFGSAGYYLPGRGVHEFLDFHAPAPAKARPDMWADLIEGEARDGFGFFLKGRVNELGYQSVSVPTAIKGLFTLHSLYGRTPWAELLRPAIDYAKGGWRVRPHVNSFWSEEGSEGRLSNPERLSFSASGRRLYCRKDGTPKLVGDLVQNPELADVLEVSASYGEDGFYRGSVADRILADHEAHGGLLSREDFAAVQVFRREPIWGEYRGYKISTNHPPGGGLLLLGMLNILENFDLKSLGHNSADYIRTVCEAMKYATIDKDAFIGDPDFVSVPYDRLLSKGIAAERAGAIRSGQRANVARLPSGIPNKDTTHLSVVDKDGNCVSMTHTLGQPSGLITDGLGFMYNGCMSVYDPRPGRNGSIEPGKRRFSSQCPSILFKDDAPYMVIGAPGATQIAMGVMQVILNSIDFYMTMTEAVSAARFSSTSNAIDVSNRISRHTTSQLEAIGYEVVRSASSYGGFAAVHAIKLENGTLDGGPDPWHDGMALSV